MLGISPATLRRMALFYEAAFIPLPTGKGGRIYPDEVLKQFQAAKQLLDERRAGKLENAFRILAKTGADADEVLAAHEKPHEALEALRRELRAVIRREVAGELMELRQEVRTLREQMLPAPQVDSNLLADLERRNRYLEGELRRRDEQPQARRPWWKVWG